MVGLYLVYFSKIFRIYSIINLLIKIQNFEKSTESKKYEHIGTTQREATHKLVHPTRYLLYSTQG